MQGHKNSLKTAITAPPLLLHLNPTGSEVSCNVALLCLNVINAVFYRMLEMDGHTIQTFLSFFHHATTNKDDTFYWNFM